MAYIVCEKCGGYYELKEGESPDDFDSCACGGNLKYVPNFNPNVDIESNQFVEDNIADVSKKNVRLENNNRNLKIILISIGLATITILLAIYLQSKSPLDLFSVTVGMVIVIAGFYIDGERGNLPVSYFVAVSGVNLFQWLIFIYIFFMDPVYVTENFLYFLLLALMFTIAIIIQIRRNQQKFNGNHEASHEDKTSTDNKESMWSDKWKIFYIFVGSLITIVCLTSFLFSKSSLDLYGSSIGMISIIYGFYREDEKFNVTKNSSLTIFAVITVQWLILFYIGFNHQGYSSREISIPTSITIYITAFFIFLIRGIGLKYIGKMRTDKKERKNYDLIIILAFLLSLILFGIDFSVIKDTLVFTILLLVSIILICWSLWYGVWKIINFITGDTWEM
jgi:hypothetical protein